MRISLWCLCGLLIVAENFAGGEIPPNPGQGRGPERLDAAVVAAGGRPNATSDDATFLRRLWLDLAGHVPPALVTREYLKDSDPEKRAKMVARLLSSEDFADHWGRVIGEWLTAERLDVRENYNGRVLHAYLRESLRQRVPYTRIVRDLVTGVGANDTSGPVNFLLRYEADPPKLAAAVGKELLGVSIQCAQCHDHPFAPWRQEDFWGLAATFARVRRMESEGDDDLKAVVETRKGELRKPDAKATDANANSSDQNEQAEPPPRAPAIEPRTLDGKAISRSGRREALSDWMVAGDNPYLRKNLVNRVWQQLFGHPLVRNLDPGAAPTQASTLLSLLADDFQANQHSLVRLIETIVLSKTYGQAQGESGVPAWSHPAVGPLSVDQLFASIAQATGHEKPLDQEALEEEEEPTGDTEEADSGSDKKANASANPEKAEDAEDEAEEENANRPVEVLSERALTLQRTLAMMNGDHTQQAAHAASGMACALLGRTIDATHYEWAFLATLSRPPTSDDQKTIRTLVSSQNPHRGLEDLFWVLLNSAEFQTNH